MIMQKSLLIAAIIVALPIAANAREPRQRDTGERGQRQIACTVSGCVPVPRGCGQVPGRTIDGSPSGFDLILCPPGVPPYR
jgi:hypothetical protein